MSRSEGQNEGYAEFFRQYLAQHSHPGNRWLHVAGTAVGVGAVATALWLRRPWWGVLGVAVGYGLSWTGHFLCERNRPATFGHPLWSLVSDFRMLGMMVRGRLRRIDD